MRILVVDDNADVALMLAELLRLDGHEDVAIASDGAEALVVIRTTSPDVVVCDLVLPGKVDGLALARTCRSEMPDRKIRLIAMSGYGGDDDRARAIDAGFDELLAKPVGFETLTETIRRGNSGS